MSTGGAMFFGIKSPRKSPQVPASQQAFLTRHRCTFSCESIAPG